MYKSVAYVPKESKFSLFCQYNKDLLKIFFFAMIKHLVEFAERSVTFKANFLYISVARFYSGFPHILKITMNTISSL